MDRTLAPSTLKTYLVQRLREAVLSGRFKPGSRLNESLIAREFGISRIPVREALFQLQESGLVTNHKRKGMFVTLLSEEDTQKINSVRMVLETEALVLARARMTPELAATLTTLVDRMESWSGDLADAAALDLEFHRTIWHASGNPHLAKALDSLVTVLFAHKTLEHISFELRQWRMNHHRALLNALLGSGDQDIRGALLTHLRIAYNDPERFSSLARFHSSTSPAREQGRGSAERQDSPQLTGSRKMQPVQTATPVS
jgi:DNA-binding GntR family transcriptional regulator